MPVEFKDYYQILGIPRDASAADIKKAFRKLARKYHPDVATDKSSAEQKFKDINEAYEVLGDPQKRQKYDQFGPGWQADAQPPPPYGRPGHTSREFNFSGTGFSDFFEQYFSGASRYGFPRDIPRGTRPARGNDIEGDILVTLDEAMHGSLRSISLQIANPQTGKVQTHEFQVRIPPGVTNGKRIRIPKQGEPGIGGADPGDLYLRVRHAAHPDFSTDGHDVYHDLDITPWEAVLGTQITVPTLDGNVTLRIPQNSENNQHLRVRGRGLPKTKSGQRGDYYAVLNIKLPQNPPPEERALWEKLRDTSTFNPRTRSSA